MASSWAIFTSSWIQPLMSKDFYFGNFQSTIRITSKVFLERGIEGGTKFTVYVLGMVLETSPLT